MKIRANKIQWDVSGSENPEETLKKLPQSIVVETLATYASDEELLEFVSDTITDQTGFCHNGFEMDIIDPLLLKADDVLASAKAMYSTLMMCGTITREHPLFAQIDKIVRDINQVRDEIKKETT